jgi:hypothetical protein
VNCDTGERAVGLVKSGGAWIDAVQYADEEKALLFAAGGYYGAQLRSNVIVISRDKLIAFIREQPHQLPGGREYVDRDRRRFNLVAQESRGTDVIKQRPPHSVTRSSRPS